MIYLYLFIEFFKIGLFTFGGGHAMVPLVQEVVIKYNWMTEEAFKSFIGVAESTPGPIAINMATYIGSTQGAEYGIFGQLLGAIVATLGVVLPSFIIIILIVTVLNTLTKNVHFNNALKGIKPVVLGLILSTGIMFAISSIGYSKETGVITFSGESIIILLLLTGFYILYSGIFKKKPNTILLILLSAILGILISLI